MSISQTINQTLVLHTNGVMEYHVQKTQIPDIASVIIEITRMAEYAEMHKPKQLLLMVPDNTETTFNRALLRWFNNFICSHLHKSGVQRVAIVTDDKFIRFVRQNRLETCIPQMFFDNYTLAMLWLTVNKNF